jgi:adenosylcobinamide-phosphate synthase
VISAAIESCAENICDSFVAPLFYFAIFGLPGAIAYRIINTFDAMIGYHGDREYTGKFAARLDDVANYIPARISALLIVIASAMTGNSITHALRIMSRDHKKTESPNAGWSMSAMAGSLGVELEKIGQYRLGDNHRSLNFSLIADSQHIMLATAALWGMFIIVKEVICCVAR